MNLDSFDKIGYSIQPYSEQNDSKMNIKLSPEIKRVLSDLLKQAPNIDFNDFRTQYIFEFSDEVIKGLKTGEFSLMNKKGEIDVYRAMVKNRKGQISEHGEMIVKGISPKKLASYSYLIVAEVVKQEQLAEINKKLENIDSKVDKILRHLNNEYKATFRTDFERVYILIKSIYSTENKINLSETIGILYRDIYPRVMDRVNKYLIDLDDIYKQVQKVKVYNTAYMNTIKKNRQLEKRDDELQEIVGIMICNLNLLNLIEKCLEWLGFNSDLLNEMKKNTTIKYDELANKVKHIKELLRTLKDRLYWNIRLDFFIKDNYNVLKQMFSDTEYIKMIREEETLFIEQLDIMSYALGLNHNKLLVETNESKEITNLYLIG